jgi:hypothetical protein
MDKQDTWFHGSPFALKMLRKGSSITQIENLAQAFSTRPSMVSVSDDGKIRHNGQSKGRIYRVAGITANDVYQHPRSSIGSGWEWLTKRDFELEFLYEYDVSYHPDDVLSEDEIREIIQRHSLP